MFLITLQKVWLTFWIYIRKTSSWMMNIWRRKNKDWSEGRATMVGSTDEKDFRDLWKEEWWTMVSLCCAPCPPLDRGDPWEQTCFSSGGKEWRGKLRQGRPHTHSLCSGRSQRIESYLNWQEKEERGWARVKVASALEPRTTLCFLSCVSCGKNTTSSRDKQL